MSLSGFEDKMSIEAIQVLLVLPALFAKWYSIENVLVKKVPNVPSYSIY